MYIHTFIYIYIYIHTSGNYRNPMPVAGRTVAVRVPVVEDPPAHHSRQHNDTNDTKVIVIII